MKELIKQSFIWKLGGRIKRNLIINREFGYDKKMYKKYYVDSTPNNINKISFNMIRIVHSIEKGFSNKNPRPFGINPTNLLIKYVKEYERITKERNFSYNMTLTCLNNYCKFFEERKWNDQPQYIKVLNFIKNRDYNIVDAGTSEYSLNELNKGMKFDFYDFLKTRHSVRSFNEKKVTDKDIREVINMALLTPSACNRQMIKIYNITDKDKINYINDVAQGVGGFDLKNISYMVITFDINSEYFIGERNQGWFNAGLFSMNLVNAMHNKGIGSCFIQFGNSTGEEDKIKKELNIPDNERIAIFIAYGYYDETTKIPMSTRKNIEMVYKKI